MKFTMKERNRLRNKIKKKEENSLFEMLIKLFLFIYIYWYEPNRIHEIKIRKICCHMNADEFI